MRQANNLLYEAAVRDFRDARRRAAVQDVVARLTGKSDDLLPYEEVKHLVKAEDSAHKGLQDIPLNAIVGSVGRYRDFTRSFLPRRDSDESRWAHVKLKSVHAGGLPPIEVYQLGAVYFVLDGNHRVSVARQLSAKTIQAYVTEIATKVPISADTQPDELIIQLRLTQFLEKSGLDRSRPETDFTVTAPGSYRELEDQIEAFRHRIGQLDGNAVPFPEIATRWHDEVYQPVVEIIRERHLLRDFQNRTDTDLFVWISRHQDTLQEDLGWVVRPDFVAEDLSARRGGPVSRSLARLGARLRQVVSPADLQGGPAAGQWRREHGEPGRDQHLFGDILLPVTAHELDWNALDQALLVAGRERARLHGLLSVSEHGEDDDEALQLFQDRFYRRCQEAAIEATLAVEVGPVAEAICRYARWTDLVVVSLSGKPGDTPAARLSSELRVVVQRCSRPVLALPAGPSALRKALLAYDGSAKAKEALFVAAYLAGRWKMPLVMLTVADHQLDTGPIAAEAVNYLRNHGVSAQSVVASGAVGEVLLRTARERNCDLILMGGYGHSPVLELVLGSAVDQVLRGGDVPVLICR